MKHFQKKADLWL